MAILRHALNFYGSLTIFAKAKWLVDFSQPKGIKYKDNYGLTEVNQPKEMQKLSKNLYFLININHFSAACSFASPPDIISKA